MISIPSSEVTLGKELSTTLNAVVNKATLNNETVVVKKPIANVKDKREAEYLSKIQHPHVIRMIGVITEGKHAYSLVFPYMSNGDLWHYLRKNSAEGQALNPVREKIILGVLRGLVYLHSIDLVHRDIKCGNILLDSDYTAKIADLGSARVVDAVTGEYDSPLAYSVTTPGHVPPEHSILTKNGVTYTTKGDMYSFGVVLSNLGNDRFRDKIAPDIDNNVSSFTKETCLLCFEPDPKKRASAAQLIERYENKIKNDRVVEMKSDKDMEKAEEIKDGKVVEMKDEKDREKLKMN